MKRRRNILTHVLPVLTAAAAMSALFPGCGGGEQPVEMLDQGALAATGVADEGHVLPGGDLQIYVV